MSWFNFYWAGFGDRPRTTKKRRRMRSRGFSHRRRRYNGGVSAKNWTEEQRIKYRENARIQRANKRANMTEEQLAKQRETIRIQRANKRATWTEEQRAKYREKDRIVKLNKRAKIRASMTPEQLKEYYKQLNLTQKNRRANMTPEQLADYYNSKRREYIHVENDKHKARQQYLQSMYEPNENPEPNPEANIDDTAFDFDIDNINVDDINLPDDFDFDDAYFNDTPAAPKRKRTTNTQTRKRRAVAPVEAALPASPYVQPPSSPYVQPPSSPYVQPPALPNSPDSYSDIDLFEYLDDPGFK